MSAVQKSDAPTMRVNDFYQWSHPCEETESKRRAGTQYWACARIAICDGKRLLDIYSMHPSEGVFQPEFGQHRSIPTDGSSELEFIANLDDYLWQGHYASHEALLSEYDAADVLSLAHPNQTRGMAYLKKGAIKSDAVRLQFLNREIDKHKRAIESSQRSIEFAITEIESIIKE